MNTSRGPIENSTEIQLLGDYMGIHWSLLETPIFDV